MSEAAHKKAVFAAVVDAYHNSFEGPVEGVFRHSTTFIRRLRESATEVELVCAALRLDPRLTSTDAGAVAIAVARAISEESEIAKAFIDLELNEPGIIANFSEHVDVEKVMQCLSEVGPCAAICRPGDMIADGILADMLLVQIEPSVLATEAIVTAMRSQQVSESTPAPAAGTPPATPPAPSKYNGAHECAALQLDPTSYSDEALKVCTLTRKQVEALFTTAFGDQGLKLAINGIMRGDKAEHVSEAPTTEVDGRNRLLRILAARGFVRATTGEAAKPAEHPLSAVAIKVIDTLVSEGEGARWSLHADAKVALTSEAFQEALDAMAVAIDEACVDEAAIFTHLHDRVMDLGLAPVIPATRAAIVESARRKGTDDAQRNAIRAHALRAVARGALLACGVAPSKDIAEARAQVRDMRPTVAADAPELAHLNALLSSSAA